MQPGKYELAQIFEGNLVYVVPSYQRLYVWNRENQWDPLWSDVEDVANHLYREIEIKGLDEVAKSNSVEAHFLGALVFKVAGSTLELTKQWRVIDGQQRLTTLQLLLAAAVSELESMGVSDQANRLKNLVANPPSATASEGTLKIDHHRGRPGHDYEHFAEVMRTSINSAEAQNTSGPMAECCSFFRQAIRRWLSRPDADISTAADALVFALLTKLNVVGIFLDPHEREHIIFETLNARGEPLTEWDKIKNFLLYRADEEPEIDQEKFYAQFLEQFDSHWWRQLVGRGEQRPRTDIFADYWLESRRKEAVAVRRVFREFQNHVNYETENLEFTMRELVKDAEYYRKFEEIDPGVVGREGVFHRRRLEMGIGAFWPLLLQIQRYEVSQSERDRCFAALESYFVRRIIVGYQARSYDQVALEALKVLPANSQPEGSIANTVIEHLLHYSEARATWPSDTELEEELSKRDIPRYAQKIVLTAVESYLIPDKAGNQAVSPNVQIEHIMPRAWAPRPWPLPRSTDPALATEKRNHLIKTIGNLTLLNAPLNSSVSNASWSIKRPAIQEHDNLFLNKELLKRSESGWTEDDIRKRGEWFFSVVSNIWPRG